MDIESSMGSALLVILAVLISTFLGLNILGGGNEGRVKDEKVTKRGNSTALNEAFEDALKEAGAMRSLVRRPRKDASKSTSYDDNEGNDAPKVPQRGSDYKAKRAVLDDLGRDELKQE